jgi:hypothetical protein
MADSPKSTVRLRKSARKKAPAAPRVIRAAPEGAVTLEEVLVAFQKSLARATRSSFEASRADAGFALGERTLYAIDGLNISLKAGCAAALGPDGKPSHVVLDFAQSPDAAGSATIDFRVQARPLEPIRGSQLILADLDPLGLARPAYRMRGTLLVQPEAPVRERRLARSASGEEAPEPPPGPPPIPERALQPTAFREVQVRIVGGDTRRVDLVTVRTNAIGQFDFEVDARTNRFLSGDSAGTLANVDLATSDDDFFVFAMCEVEAGTPLVSNMLHFEVKRAPAEE